MAQSLSPDPERVSIDGEKSHQGVPKQSPPPLNDPIANGNPNSQEVGRNTPNNDDDKYSLPLWKFTLVMIALALSVLCMALDNSILATAIPRITDHFHALDDVGWYGSAYMLTLCATPLLYGKFYSFYSLKWVFISAVSLFEIGSAVCGAAPSSTALIIGRAVAGLGGAGIFTGAILIIAATVPLYRRPMYNGIVGAMYGIAGVGGPLLGGAFTDRISWRWCFYINLPLGAVTILFIIAFLRVKSSHKSVKLSQLAREVDIPGNILFMPSVICLLLALQWGGTKYPWTNGRIIALFVLFVVLIIGFILIQILTGERATVPPRIFTNRNVWGSCWYGLCLGSSFFIIVFYLPIWFQAIKGVSAVHSSIMNLPLILSLSFFSMSIGGIITIIRHYVPFLFLSSIFMAIGAGLITTFSPSTGHPKWMGYQIIFGFGVGIGMQLTPIIIQNSLAEAEIAIGIALVLFSQTFGGAIFISVSQNVFTNQLVKDLRQVVPQLDPTFILNVGATQLRDEVPAALLLKVLVAYDDALTRSFYAAVAMGALAILSGFAVEWKRLKKEVKAKHPEPELGEVERKSEFDP